MNYLAHLYLAQDDDELMVGNFIGDFVKGRIEDHFRPGVRKGIIHHRKIDSFTDFHPVVRRCRRLISRKRRKFSGVMIDVFFDFFLTQKWEDYSEEPLDSFIERSYMTIKRFEDIIPQNAKKLLPGIAKNNWLGRYGNIKDLGSVFRRLSIKVRRGHLLIGAEEELIVNYRGVESYFDTFFPELIEFSLEVKSVLAKQ